MKFYVRQYTDAYRIFGGVDSILLLKNEKSFLDGKIDEQMSRMPMAVGIKGNK